MIPLRYIDVTKSPGSDSSREWMEPEETLQSGASTGVSDGRTGTTGQRAGENSTSTLRSVLPKSSSTVHLFESDGQHAPRLSIRLSGTGFGEWTRGFAGISTGDLLATTSHLSPMSPPHEEQEVEEAQPEQLEPPLPIRTSSTTTASTASSSCTDDDDGTTDLASGSTANFGGRTATTSEVSFRSADEAGGQRPSSGTTATTCSSLHHLVSQDPSWYVSMSKDPTGAGHRQLAPDGAAAVPTPTPTPTPTMPTMPTMATQTVLEDHASSSSTPVQTMAAPAGAPSVTPAPDRVSTTGSQSASPSTDRRDQRVLSVRSARSGTLPKVLRKLSSSPRWSLTWSATSTESSTRTSAAVPDMNGGTSVSPYSSAESYYLGHCGSSHIAEQELGGAAAVKHAEGDWSCLVAGLPTPASDSSSTPGSPPDADTSQDPRDTRRASLRSIGEAIKLSRSFRSGDATSPPISRPSNPPASPAATTSPSAMFKKRFSASPRSSTSADGSRPTKPSPQGPSVPGRTGPGSKAASTRLASLFSRPQTAPSSASGSTASADAAAELNTGADADPRSASHAAPPDAPASSPAPRSRQLARPAPAPFPQQPQQQQQTRPVSDSRQEDFSSISGHPVARAGTSNSLSKRARTRGGRRRGLPRPRLGSKPSFFSLSSGFGFGGGGGGNTTAPFTSSAAPSLKSPPSSTSTQVSLMTGSASSTSLKSEYYSTGSHRHQPSDDSDEPIADLAHSVSQQTLKAKRSLSLWPAHN